MGAQHPKLDAGHFHDWRVRHEEANRETQRSLTRNLKIAITLAVVAVVSQAAALVERLV